MVGKGPKRENIRLLGFPEQSVTAQGLKQKKITSSLYGGTNSIKGLVGLVSFEVSLSWPCWDGHSFTETSYPLIFVVYVLINLCWYQSYWIRSLTTSINLNDLRLCIQIRPSSKNIGGLGFNKQFCGDIAPLIERYNGSILPSKLNSRNWRQQMFGADFWLVCVRDYNKGGSERGGTLRGEQTSCVTWLSQESIARRHLWGLLSSSAIVPLSRQKAHFPVIFHLTFYASAIHG